MKLISIGSVVDSSCCIKEYQFGIRTEDLGMNLNTLRSKMYSDPINAICREISSNSRDANREVGNENIPIRINFNDAFNDPGDLTISFSDDGPGISPDRMANIFVNYGASTKRDTNKQTGGFGYGAKTPFSYADSFQIVTKVDGIKYTYIAAIEETGTGKIYLLDEKPVTEKNGTSIIISVKKQDKQKFMYDVVRNTFFWKVKPITNIDIEYPKNDDITKINNFLVLSSKFRFLFSNHIFLLIDDIPYVLDDQLLSISLGNYQSIFIPFKTGELTISANRESVQYDKQTIDKITKKYNSSVEHVFTNFQDQINQQESYFKACVFLEKVKKIKNNELFFNILRDNKKDTFTFNNKVISNRWKYQRIALFGLSNYRKTQIDRIHEFINLNETVYLMDVQKLCSSRNKTLLKSNNSFLYIEFVNKDLRNFSKLPFSHKKTLVRTMRSALDEIQSLREEGWSLSLYSKVEKTYEKKEYQKRDSINVLVYNTSKYKFFYLKYFLSEFEKHEFVYFISDDINKDANKSFVISWIKFLRIISKRQIIVIKSKQLKHFKNNGISLDDYLKNFDKKQMEDAYLSTTISSFERRELSFLSRLSLNKDLIKNISILNQRVIKLQKCSENLPEKFLEYFPIDPLILQTIEDVRNIRKRYPLLGFIEFEQPPEGYKILINELNKYFSLYEKKDET